MSAPLYDVTEQSQAKIVEWRFDSFRRLGFTRLDANALAIRRDIDRALVASMRAADCPPAKVMDIVL